MFGRPITRPLVHRHQPLSEGRRIDQYGRRCGESTTYRTPRVEARARYGSSTTERVMTTSSRELTSSAKTTWRTMCSSTRARRTWCRACRCCRRRSGPPFTTTASAGAPSTCERQGTKTSAGLSRRRRCDEPRRTCVKVAARRSGQAPSRTTCGAVGVTGQACRRTTPRLWHAAPGCQCTEGCASRPTCVMSLPVRCSPTISRIGSAGTSRSSSKTGPTGRAVRHQGQRGCVEASGTTPYPCTS
ncbi:uncharacterized protein PFL1_05747 [Pseudozyma flocculosa PF-1]|uniref:Uncharacterized protein n=1 Tax=Pseudozyma flocculosa PF-1 TaxID=1277687 RepID=A0A061H2Q9_9BASI|nr:uncharacterized protein PFL1_05747 [Pseudozyma flocculosa PF-1]EPQ26768.1 hypothetical protein PFL1_05747 [Pseudozyma flocculosa PF-1]